MNDPVRPAADSITYVGVIAAIGPLAGNPRRVGQPLHGTRLAEANTGIHETLHDARVFVHRIAHNRNAELRMFTRHGLDRVVRPP